MPPKRERAPEPRVTRSQTEDERAAKKAKAAADLLAAEEELARKRADDLAKRPKPAPGNRGDGQLHVAFIRVGQGDCTVMSTPQGRIILFDCGAKPKEGARPTAKESNDQFADRLKAILGGPKFMKGHNRIDVLITSHPDADHYNKLKAVLPDTVVIDNWYHSAVAHSYAQAQVSDFIQGRLSNKPKRVILNNDLAGGAPGQVTINEVPVPLAGGGKTIDRIDSMGGIRILEEPACTVTILAAGVTHSYLADSSNDTNRGSIVTLVEANGAKILMCGDATVNTEKFLLNTGAANRIADMTIVQAGHHGSINTSSSTAFIKKVNPEMVVISAGWQIPKDHLPSEGVITRYTDRLTTSKRPVITAHETFFWQPGALGSYINTSAFGTYPVFSLGSRDTIYYTKAASA